MSAIRAVLSFALSTCWAMEEQFHRRMMAVLFRHADGIKLTDEEIEAATGSASPKVAADYTVDRGIAIIPIHGVIAHRAAAVGRVSSRVGASVETIRGNLQAAIADPEVSGVLLDIDSPGGSVSGIAELADEIRAARDVKPIVAHTDAMMASAAYWLGSQANHVSATRSAMVGSIGVITSFYDSHRAAQNDGYDPVIIKSVPGKGSVQANGTFGDADRADLQAEVDHYHEMFVEGVAAGRSVDMAKAKAMGDGRAYVGKKAEQLGFVDAIESRAQALRKANYLVRGRAAAVTNPAAAGDSQEDEDHMVVKTNAGDADANADPKHTATIDAGEAAKAAAKAASDAAASAVEAERSRVRTILEAAVPEQAQLAQQLAAGDKPLDEALAVLAADLRERFAKLRTKPAAETPALGGGNSAQVAGQQSEADRIKAMPDGTAKFKAEFAASAELQAEFGGDEASYLAYRSAHAEGRVKKTNRKDAAE